MSARFLCLLIAAWFASAVGCAEEDDPGRWVVIDTPTTGNLSGLWGFSPTELYVVGTEYFPEGDNPTGIVLKYDGETWSRVLEFKDCSLSSVWGASSSELFVSGACQSLGGDSVGVVIATDGDSFHKYELDYLHVGAVFGFGASDVYAISGADVLHFDGSSWTRVWQGVPMVDEAGEVLTDLWGTNGELLAVGGDRNCNSSEVLVVEMTGGEWSRHLGDEYGLLWGIGGNGGKSVAVGVNRGNTGDDVGVVLESTSSTWSSMKKLEGGWHKDAWVGDDGEILVIGSSPIVMRYSSGSWKKMDCPTEEQLTDIWGIGDSVFAVGYNGVVIERVRD